MIQTYTTKDEVLREAEKILGKSLREVMVGEKIDIYIYIYIYIYMNTETVK